MEIPNQKWDESRRRRKVECEVLFASDPEPAGKSPLIPAETRRLASA
jgi:hypothetical protein